MSCLGHHPCSGARYWPREARSLCGCFVRRWVRTCSWSVPGLNLLDFLVVGPCLDRLVLYRERDASIDCLWSRMQSLFHQAFPFEAAVVNSLGVFKVEAVISFSCVHPDERGPSFTGPITRARARMMAQAGQTRDNPPPS